MRKRLGSLVLASTLGVSGLAAGVALAPTIANAATSSSASAAPSEAAAPGTDPDRSAQRSSRISDALSGLVQDGTLTQAQADKVAETLASKMPSGGHGHGGPGRGLDTAATVLGVSDDDLRTALRDGKSLADVAAEKGVDKQKLIDELVKAAETRLAERVSSGDITQAEADERKADLRERVTTMVDRKGLPERPDRGGDRPGD